MIIIGHEIAWYEMNIINSEQNNLEKISEEIKLMSLIIQIF